MIVPCPSVPPTTEHVKDSEQLSPDAITYGSAIFACIKGARPQMALEVRAGVLSMLSKTTGCWPQRRLSAKPHPFDL
jgi:hypothetical protein